MLQLAQKLAVVTGAGSGIGRELVRQLVAEGCHVAMCDINGESLRETDALLRASNPFDVRTTTFVADTSDREAMRAFAADVRERHTTDHIDLLVNNAGHGGGESFVTGPEEEWERTFDVCWRSVYGTTRAFLPLLMASPASHIVNIASINAVMATIGAKYPVTAYASAKFAVRGFTESLVTDLALHAPNVRAVLVIPGGVSTSITQNSARLLGKDPLTLTEAQITDARRHLETQGVDVDALSDDEVRGALVQQQKYFDGLGKLSPARAATIILDGLRAGKWRIVVGNDAFLADRVVRRHPSWAFDVQRRRIKYYATVRDGGLMLTLNARDKIRRRWWVASGRSASPDLWQAPPMSRTKSVLITGASTGIGEAAALHFDRLGWRVFAGVRKQEDGERLRAQATERLTPVILDVADEAQVNDVLAKIDELLGEDGLDGLVNNAGISVGGPIEILPLDEWRRLFEVNLLGQVAVTKAALPALRRAFGRIVFVGSISGRSAPAYGGPYAASKYALEAVGSSLREELRPWGIRISMVEPGIIDTPIWRKGPTLEEFKAMVGGEKFELYRRRLEGLTAHVEMIAARGIPATKVAKTVEHALTATRPLYRYLVGRDAQIIGITQRALPDRIAMRIRRRL
jgi:NAD(P)-dependent dehydrogenase (short-subunit alcohol dehydrogenase family)